MKNVYTVFLLSSLAFFLSGCCCGEEFNSAFQEGFNEGVAESFDDMSGKLRRVEDSPEKARVQTILDDGREAALDGRYGAVKVGIFQADFDKAVADGEITKREADKLEKTYKRHVKE